MGSTPAPGVASRRPRRVAGPCAESLSSESVRRPEKVTGEGANHGARSGRAPPLQHSYGFSRPHCCTSSFSDFLLSPDECISHITRLYLEKLKKPRKLKRYRPVSLAGSRALTRVVRQIEGRETKLQTFASSAVIPTS